jgi:hypothetical protein
MPEPGRRRSLLPAFNPDPVRGLITGEPGATKGEVLRGLAFALAIAARFRAAGSTFRFPTFFSAELQQRVVRTRRGLINDSL